MLRGGAATLNELEAATAHELLGLGPHRNGGRSSSRISESTAKQSFGSRNQSSGNEAWECFFDFEGDGWEFLGMGEYRCFLFFAANGESVFFFRSCCHLFRRCLHINMKPPFIPRFSGSKLRIWVTKTPCWWMWMNWKQNQHWPRVVIKVMEDQHYKLIVKAFWRSAGAYRWMSCNIVMMHIWLAPKSQKSPRPQPSGLYQH